MLYNFQILNRAQRIYKTTLAPATVCSPCCRPAKDTGVSAAIPPDYGAASFPQAGRLLNTFSTLRYIFFSCVVILTLQLSAIPKKHQISLYNTKENNFKPVVPTFISKQSSALFGTASRFKSL